MITDEQMHNIILVHVARTWERIRLRQPYNEMPQDNIESASVAIPEIAYEIYKDDVIQKLINYKKNDWDWEVMTKGETHFSDLYIEGRAEEIIYNEYIHENDVLIAEFMGVVFHDDENQYYNADGLHIGNTLQYHTSWDWLMPVMAKLVKDFGSGWIFEEGYDLNTRYHAVVKFIKQMEYKWKL